MLMLYISVNIAVALLPGLYQYLQKIKCLLSPYFCFISFLYLGLYVLGDDAWISLGSFMQTKHLYVLLHI